MQNWKEFFIILIPYPFPNKFANFLTRPSIKNLLVLKAARYDPNLSQSVSNHKSIIPFHFLTKHDFSVEVLYFDTNLIEQENMNSQYFLMYHAVHLQ